MAERVNLVVVDDGRLMVAGRKQERHVGVRGDVVGGRGDDRIEVAALLVFRPAGRGVRAQVVLALHQAQEIAVRQPPPAALAALPHVAVEHLPVGVRVVDVGVGYQEELLAPVLARHTRIGVLGHLDRERSGLVLRDAYTHPALA